MSSEEEDYMSDAFLQKCQNVRPGLIPKHVQKLEEKKKKTEKLIKVNQSVPKKKLELQQRETGLKTEVSTSSKGFLMLQKMGYKPGTGIGKSGEGRTEPIPIEVKSGREGLGREMERKRRSFEMNERRAVMAAKKQKYCERQTQSFISRMKDRFAEKSVEKDLRTAQNTCLQLDGQQGIEIPTQPFFWPAHSLPMLDDDEDELDEETDQLNDNSDSDVDDDGLSQSDLPVADKLEILTTYLRQTYKYCIWCGTKYDDEEELNSDCPGNSADSHS